VIQSARGKMLMTLALFVTLGSCGMVRAADGDTGTAHFMYVGTLDHKLLVFDEEKEAVVVGFRGQPYSPLTRRRSIS
jgi:hypothetical protein